MVLKRVGVFSLGKVAGILYAVFGLIAGGILSLVAIVGAAAGAAAEGWEALFAVLFGVGAVIVLPLLYGLMGFIGGLITAVIYNFVAGVAGGVVLELE